MFWKKRKPPLRLVPFAEARPRTFNRRPCDGVTAYGLNTFAQLLALHEQLQRERPDVRVLASLDDLGQAAYTSGHVTDMLQLDGGGEEAAPFPVWLANLEAASEAIGLAEATGVIDWETSGDSNDLVTVNADPDAVLLIKRQSEVIFQFVPVTAAADAIAVFPNGYFASDLSPMQNLAIARRLEARHGLALFGIGARFLGFRSVEALSALKAAQVAEDVAALYANAPDDVSALARLLEGRDWLLFRYTES